MKKTVPALFLPALLFILAACPITSDNSATINGTVTITRNGIPWNSANFSPYHNSRSPGPPNDRPVIYAYSKGAGWIGSASVYYRTSDDSYRNGTYQWKLDVPDDKLPSSVYFEVFCHMTDIQLVLTTTTEEFWIQDENTVVDIGLINFEVVRLSGNLPITVNSKPLEDYEHAVGRMHIFNLTNGSPLSEWNYPSSDVYISPEGDWSLNISRPDSETPLLFQVEVRQNGGSVKKMLNTDYAITVYDTDKEIVFPDYPSVNLEAFVLSGTIEVVSPGTGESRYYSIKFFREGGEFSGNDYYPYSYLLSDTTTGWSVSGRNSWNTMIPVLELPHELFYSFTFQKGSNVYRGHSSIIITDDTDLSNIDLGVFTFE